MSKVVKLTEWHPDGGWWWEIEGNAGRVTEYRTDRDYTTIHVKIENGQSSHWSKVGEVDFPHDFHGMVLLLARDGHDISAL